MLLQSKLTKMRFVASLNKKVPIPGRRCDNWESWIGWEIPVQRTTLHHTTIALLQGLFGTTNAFRAQRADEAIE